MSSNLLKLYWLLVVRLLILNGGCYNHKPTADVFLQLFNIHCCSQFNDGPDTVSESLDPDPCSVRCDIESIDEVLDKPKLLLKVRTPNATRLIENKDNVHRFTTAFTSYRRTNMASGSIIVITITITTTTTTTVSTATTIFTQRMKFRGCRKLL